MLLARIANYITEKALTKYLYEPRFIGPKQSHILFRDCHVACGSSQ